MVRNTENEDERYSVGLISRQEYDDIVAERKSKRAHESEQRERALLEKLKKKYD